jgi:hypothetical protein
MVLIPRRRSFVADPPDREDLSGQVRDVAEVQHPRCRRHGAEQAIGEIVERLRRHREGHLLQLDAITPHALLPGIEHAPVILVRGHDFVAGFQRDAELRNLERLARVPGDGHLFGIAPELRREPAPHGLDVRLQDLPHVIHGRLVGQIEVALQGVVNHARARAAAAVVQIDDRAVQRERLLDLAPVVLVARHACRRIVLHRSRCRLQTGETVVAEHRGGGDRRGPRRAGGLQKRAAREHVVLPARDQRAQADASGRIISRSAR